jgi:hypothetical protein
MGGLGLSAGIALAISMPTGASEPVPLSAATNVVAVFDAPDPATMLRPPTGVVAVFEEPIAADMLVAASNVQNTITP